MYEGFTQGTLFTPTLTLPHGLLYRDDFLTESEEEVLVAYIENLPLVHPRYEGYKAKRRVMNFGWSFDDRREKLIEGLPLPQFLRPLQRKIAKWLSISADRVVEALVTEYIDGAAIGWHRDNEPFESIVGISLAGPCMMRFRPIASKGLGTRTARDIVSLPLKPRSAYVMQHDIRWHWQHSIPAVEMLRYSITFRTLAG